MKLPALVFCAAFLLTAACGGAYEPARPQPLVSLPEDEAPHDAGIEWWYFNGLLTDDQGREYSYHYVTFQGAGAGTAIPHLLQASLGDHTAGEHLTGERVILGALDPNAVGIDVSVKGWKMQGDGEVYHLEFDLAEEEWAQVFAGSAEGDTGTPDSPAAETPAPSPPTPPAADLVAETPRPRRRISTTLWGTAAVVLVLIMAVQLVHFSRQDLVVHPTFGPWVRNVYSAMGMDVNPVWDLAQYQIRKRVTTSIDELGQMPITTTIQNTAPFAQPYPLVRLILWDRWGDTVETLTFDPEQYLQPAPSAGELLEPYKPVEAAISVVRPDTEEITGFDLDVCLRTERGLVQCARDLGG